MKHPIQELTDILAGNPIDLIAVKAWEIRFREELDQWLKDFQKDATITIHEMVNILLGIPQPQLNDKLGKGEKKEGSKP